MAKRKDQIDKDARELIQLVTGFDGRDENFHLCVSYAESNFKYHRYLSPDSHKIHRSIDGLCEKFEVHSQKQKATDLKELTELFLEQTGLDGKDTGKTDVHYAMLSLLICLAESPTKQDFQRKKKEVLPEEVDNFDWKSYLLDNEDLNFMSFMSSDSEPESLPHSSDEDEEERDTMKLFGNLFALNPENTSANKSVVMSRTASSVTPADQISWMSQPDVSQTDEYMQLVKTLVVEYWNGKGREEETCGSHVASNLARDWNCYQRQMNEFHTPKAQSPVTELQVIRETLWMLSGITELYIFKYNGKEFSLNPDIYIMHLTSESLESSLRPMMRKAEQVCVLQSFVSYVVSQVCSSMSSGDSEARVPQTYQAFASSVSQFLTDFRQELRNLEMLVMKQEELVSLEKLSNTLQLWLAKVQAVHGIYITGIASVTSWEDGSHNINNCFRASLLLNVLYQSVFESDFTSLLDSESKSSLMLQLLIKSSKPLIQITSDWINNGQLSDPAGEFVVQRNKGITSLNETFWDQAFVSSLKPSALDISLLDVTASQTANQEAFTSTTLTNTTSQKGSKENSCESPDFYVKLGPKFLQPILGDAILTGKSMEMLENLGRMGEVLDVGCGVYERPPSLFELFVRDLKEQLGSVPDSKDSSSSHGTVPSAEMTFPQDAIVNKQLNMRGTKDTLLNINFATLFCNISSQSSQNKMSTEDDVLKAVSSDHSPLLRLCERCLYPHVRSRYETVCSKLVHILKTEYHLMDCIHAMQRYYLMSSGEVMYDFYMPIFTKIQNRENWRNMSLLELYLHEAVAPRYPGDLSKEVEGVSFHCTGVVTSSHLHCTADNILSVSISPAAKHKEKSPIGLTDCVQLKYKVPWPVDVVISGKCQALYNDIFTFLLQVKRAKHSVDQLRFEELSRHQAVPTDLGSPHMTEESAEEAEKMTRELRIHRCQILRFRLLYFVNSLHNYIMTRILHSTGLEFASQLEGARDLEQIISVHREYVEAIHQRCLLHPRLSFVREAVVNVLNLSLTFTMHWRQGIDFVSGSSIKAMEVDLSRCIHFLSAFLNNVIKRGSFPHLESLAFSLLSPLSQDKMS